MNQNRFKGFTLIELLVVIAIIGILSAVVLASLNTARSKGNDAAIKSNLDTIRTQSVLYYDSNNNYGPAGQAAISAAVGNATCALAASMFVDPNIAAAVKAADAAAGGTGSPTSVVKCGFNAGLASWIISAKLVGSNYWCVDSVGASKTESADVVGAAVACL